MPPVPGRTWEEPGREGCAARWTSLQGRGFLEPASVTGVGWVRDPVRLEVMEMPGGPEGLRKDTRNHLSKWDAAR